MSGIAMPEPDPRILARRDQIVAGLREIVPGEGVIDTEDERRAFETDALTAYRRMPLAVVLPSTTEEVAAVLKYLNGQGVPIIPRGAGTSLAGGALPQEDAVVVGVSKMACVLDVNLADRTMRVQTGITNLGVSGAIAHEGFFYAPDPSSQLACTIAGNVAMNSGGAHCLKYGVTTNNLMGVTFVTMEGEIVEIGGDAMDAPGLDLLGLICGSEGQFGMVTEATLRILPMAEGARPILFGFPSSEAAGAATAAVIGAGIVPVAIEFMDKIAIDICEDFAHAGYPMDAGALLIVEVEGAPAEIDEQLARIGEVARANGATSARQATTAAEAAAIWKGRKSAFGAMGRISDYICMDGTIPTGRLPEILARITDICDAAGLKVANIFHAGDGNLHPLVLYDMNDPVSLAKAEHAGEEILLACVEVGGCLTGEHGVGIEKRELMTAQFTEAELFQQMRVKSAFDPNWLMNPAKVFPLELRAETRKAA
ncbi:FAD-binding protein [Chelatococcus sambhunathii]|uniref:FAD-binding protein n=1 Tax=Chelatococcus sambhunathii TaxID=363953 RepID=A0ABU1DK40_9HYPH|nr:FAD-linked oxidase C-terminal domain-containing protein [Chelatococcus sambhunathii]MDR4308483.1 FAD-binding protein [Chelatococcus sambhunathii]